MFDQREFRGCEDAAEQVVEIVRDATSQLSDRFELLAGKRCF